LQDVNSKLLIPVLVGLVIAVFSAGAGVVVQKRASDSDHSTRYLDYVVSPPRALLSSQSIPGHEISIAVDGQRIETIGLSSVTIYNFSDRDFEDVPIYVELLPYGDDLMEVVSARVSGSGYVPENVVELDTVEPSPLAGSKRFGYRVLTANRSRTDPVFQADFFVASERPPLLLISGTSKGLRLRAWDHSDSVGDNVLVFRKSRLWLMGVTVAFAAVVIVLANLKERRDTQKQDLEFRDALLVAFSSDTEGLGISRAQAEPLASATLRRFQIWRWERIPSWLRPITSVPRPPNSQQ
jgi:hypothetical protein